METSAPRGTRDIMFEEARSWQKAEELLRELAATYGYSEIRTPIFEHTELFRRGVGEATDIVEKEMYTFEDRGGRSITLRPENTAPVMRAYIEHSLGAKAQPTKLYYLGPMFRYERPQAGRFRQFHQMGVEYTGSKSAMADAEVIRFSLDYFRLLGIREVVVHLNSIGCPACRPAYKQALRDAYEPKLSELCPSCNRRFEANPLRLLDCKSPECRAALPNPPRVEDYLCEECAKHFAELKGALDALGVKYVLDPRLVRGLDYYTKTTFEFTSEGLGSQDAIGGGGRYDGLIEELGGAPTPSVGVACGMERLITVAKAQGGLTGALDAIDAFVAYMGEESAMKALSVAFELRDAGLSAEFDTMGRSLKAQMKYAGKLNARFVAIIGADELEKGAATVKDMAAGTQADVPFEGLQSYLADRCRV
jgi:histidyl-tRNA synthetase